VRSMTGVKS